MLFSKKSDSLHGRDDMNILFLSLIFYKSVNVSDIYADLLREFIKHGHKISIISPAERRRRIPSGVVYRRHYEILYVKTGNLQKTNAIEKGISYILLEKAYKAAIRKYFSVKKFDLVLYVTPPITFTGAVKYVKHRDGAKTYLMLKDIFPQNAVDLGFLKKYGWKKLIYVYFREKEKQLYQISDYIGCMSSENIAYIRLHNPEIQDGRTELCPNCMEPSGCRLSMKERDSVREMYGIPKDRFVFIYGGNLGKAQGIPLIVECIRQMEKYGHLYWVIAGSGTEYEKIENTVQKNRNGNVKLIRELPVGQYERLVRACDCGMIFLDYRFTIPNFPSRLLSYMNGRLPVLAVTDDKSDVGSTICQGDFGWNIQNGSAAEVIQKMDEISQMDGLQQYGDNAYRYLELHYTAKAVFDIIIKHVAENGKEK